MEGEQKEIIYRLISVFEKDQTIEFAYLFGSLAREQKNRLSDIDVAVYLKDGYDPIETKLHIIGELSNNLGTEQFDLVILNSAPLHLSARIIRSQMVLIDRNPFKRHLFESRILREYFDFSILEMKILKRRFGID